MSDRPLFAARNYAGGPQNTNTEICGHTSYPFGVVKLADCLLLSQSKTKGGQEIAVVLKSSSAMRPNSNTQDNFKQLSYFLFQFKMTKTQKMIFDGYSKWTYYAFPYFPFPFGEGSRACKQSAKYKSLKYTPEGATVSYKKHFSQMPETPHWNSILFLCYMMMQSRNIILIAQ